MAQTSAGGPGSAPPAHLPEYDLARCVAMAFVVSLHTLRFVDASAPALAWYVNGSYALLLVSNMVFFMISGRFNLRESAADHPGRYYLKKLRGIAVPMLALFLIRTVWELRADLGGPGHVLRAFAHNTLYDFGSTEYWFVYALVPLLVATPLLARSLNPSRVGAGRLLMGLGALYLGTLYLTSNLGIPFGWDFMFGCAAIYYCLGPTVEKIVGPAVPTRWLALATAASVALNTALYTACGWTAGAFDNSALFMVSSIGAYLLLLRAGRRIGSRRAQRALAFLGGHAFTVYLVHIMVMDVLQPRLPWPAGAAGVCSQWALALATLALSVALAVALDAAVVRPLQRLVDLVVAALSRRRA